MSKTMDELCVNTIRTLAMDAVQRANSGHPGTPMALAPVVYCLWQRVLRFDPAHPIWPNRDRFVLSAGHASMLLYAMLHLTGVRAVNPIIVDEAHCFFGARAVSSADAAVQTGNVLLVTHRPSLIAPHVLESIGAFILAQTTVEQERYFVDAILRARGPGDLDVSTALRALKSPRGGLLSRDDGVPRWQTFVPRPRLSAQAIHTRRYADIALPPEKGFFFRLPDDGTVAAASTLEEFDRALASVPTASLQYHVARGDFSRWARDVLGDADLAAGLAKLEVTSGTGAPVEREELRRHLHARYVV